MGGEEGGRARGIGGRWGRNRGGGKAEVKGEVREGGWRMGGGEDKD